MESQNNPCIVLIVHGFAAKAEKYNELKKLVEECYPGAECIVPQLPLHLFSMAHPNEIVKLLLDELDKAWQTAISNRKEDESLPKVVLIGHSAGCLLTRKLYIVGCGENKDCVFEDDTFDRKQRGWAKQVERVILLAGINTGWTSTQHLNNKKAIVFGIGVLLGKIISLIKWKKPFAFHLKKGSPFISNLRLQWIWMKKYAGYNQIPEPLTIQLLGTVDDIVPPENNIDIYSGSRFVYLELPNSDHSNVLQMDEKLAQLSEEDIDKRRKRAEVFRDALLKDKDYLLKIQENTLGTIVSKEDTKITEVVFVIHGIRDTAYWTQKMANRIRAYGLSKGKHFATETSSYGYFSMLQFLLMGRRISKMEWLVDQYIENLALYPNAHDGFSFFGHSNGTYLLAAAFKRYPAIKFKNVILAGSVVHKKFEWDVLQRNGKLQNYFNLTATGDWVVGIFPKAFERVRFMDLGSGGFDGFKNMGQDKQVKYIKGGHGEGTTEKYWNEIAYFIVHGQPSEKVAAFTPFERPPFMKFLGYTAPLPFLFIIAVLAAIGYGLYAFLTHKGFSMENKILLEMLYLFILWKLVTKF